MTLAASYRILATHLAAHNAMEADYVRALADAASYRQILQVSLEALALEHKRAESLQERLHQIAGIVPWNSEQSE